MRNLKKLAALFLAGALMLTMLAGWKFSGSEKSGGSCPKSGYDREL